MGQVHHIAVRDSPDESVLVIGDRQGPEAVLSNSCEASLSALPVFKVITFSDMIAERGALSSAISSLLEIDDTHQVFAPVHHVDVHDDVFSPCVVRIVVLHVLDGCLRGGI